MPPKTCHATTDETNTTKIDECIHDVYDGTEKHFSAKKVKKKGADSDVDDNN